MKNKIYRVEDARGHGMYCGSGYERPLSREATSSMIESIRHPEPDDDAKLGPIWSKLTYTERAKYNFGFASIDQLKFWIYKDEWRKALNDDGFRVNIYEATYSYLGETQAIFLKKSEDMCGSLSLIDLDFK